MHLQALARHYRRRFAVLVMVLNLFGCSAGISSIQLGLLGRRRGIRTTILPHRNPLCLIRPRIGMVLNGSQDSVLWFGTRDRSSPLRMTLILTPMHWKCTQNINHGSGNSVTYRLIRHIRLSVASPHLVSIAWSQFASAKPAAPTHMAHISLAS